MTLSEAQIAKLELSLRKCDLRPGQTLLEVGCGWGACAFHAAATRQVNVIGLTLSKSQLDYCEQKISGLPPGPGNVEFRHMGWEQFEEPVDRIISIAAFEHFGFERQAQFFKHCRRLLPPDGRLMVHTIVNYDLKDLEEKELEVTCCS
jgi:cyclopropane-fatty-acyl-phospholipid synthase